MTAPDGMVRIPAQRGPPTEVADQRVPRPVQGRGHPAHRLLHQRHLRHGGKDEGGRRAVPGHADTYFEVVDQRIPNHGEDLDRLRRNKILIDADPRPSSAAAADLHQNAVGPIFFEIIQRKNNEGFGRAISRRCSRHRARPDAPRRAAAPHSPGAAERTGFPDHRWAAARLDLPCKPTYQSGFGNRFATEAIPSTLPVGMNSPQRAARPVRRAAVGHPLHRRRATSTAAAGCTASARRRAVPSRPAAATPSTTISATAPVDAGSAALEPAASPTASTDFLDGPVSPSPATGAPPAGNVGIPPLRRQSRHAMTLVATTPTASC